MRKLLKRLLIHHINVGIEKPDLILLVELTKTLIEKLRIHVLVEIQPTDRLVYCQLAVMPCFIIHNGNKLLG